MVRRAPKLPLARSGGVPDLAISGADWQRIEGAYGQQLSGSVRAAIVKKTQELVYWESFERTAEPIAKTQRLIDAYKKSARHFQLTILADGPSDAAVYARHLTRKHFKDARLSGTVECFHSLSGVLTSFQSACINALRELGPPPSTRALSGDFRAFKEGEAWALWTRQLTGIMKMNGLPSGVRKDAGNKSRSDKQSPFVLLVRELQHCLPPGCKYPEHSKAALAKAIVKARRAVVSGPIRARSSSE